MAARNAALRRPPRNYKTSDGFSSRPTSNQEVVLYAVDAEEDLSPPGVPKAVEGRRILRPYAIILELLPLQAELRDVDSVNHPRHNTLHYRSQGVYVRSELARGLVGIPLRR